MAVIAAMSSMAALGVAAVPAAAADTTLTVTPPSNVLTNFNGTGGTFTFNGFDGGTSNLLVTTPGSSHNASTTLDMLDLGNGSMYTAPIGFTGFAAPFSGCAFGSGGGSTDTATSTFNAPATAGIYTVSADLGPNFTCEDSWHSTTNQPVAMVVVTSFDSVCALAESYSTNPAVAAGLCDKLYEAQLAYDAGATKAEANILTAFDRQVKAQTGKALTSDQAATLMTLVDYLP